MALAPDQVPYGQKPPVPKCGDDSRQLLVLRRDLGSLRVPPFVAFFAFSLLFGLTLLCLIPTGEFSHVVEYSAYEAVSALAVAYDNLRKRA